MCEADHIHLKLRDGGVPAPDPPDAADAALPGGGPHFRSILADHLLQVRHAGAVLGHLRRAPGERVINQGDVESLHGLPPFGGRLPKSARAAASLKSTPYGARPFPP